MFGRNESQWLGAGWYPLHAGPAGLPCRWMAPRAEIRADVDKVKSIIITVSPATGARGRPGLSLFARDMLIGHCSNLGNAGQWSAAEFLLESAISGGSVLTLVSENREQAEPVPVSFVPHQTLGNGDWRELGLLVSSIRILRERVK